jgi:hypothetical protein
LDVIANFALALPVDRRAPKPLIPAPASRPGYFFKEVQMAEGPNKLSRWHYVLQWGGLIAIIAAVWAIAELATR